MLDLSRPCDACGREPMGGVIRIHKPEKHYQLLPFGSHDKTKKHLSSITVRL